MTNVPVTYGSSQRAQLYMPKVPSRVKMVRYVDGFKAIVPMGSFFTGGLLMGGALVVGLLMVPNVVLPMALAGLVGTGILAWRAAFKLLGQLSVLYREGKIIIKEGIQDLVREETIEIEQIRRVKRVKLKRWDAGGSKREAIEIQTTSKTIQIGRHLSKRDRNFVYDTLIFYLEQSMYRVP